MKFPSVSYDTQYSPFLISFRLFILPVTGYCRFFSPLSFVNQLSPPLNCTCVKWDTVACCILLPSECRPTIAQCWTILSLCQVTCPVVGVFGVPRFYFTTIDVWRFKNHNTFRQNTKYTCSLELIYRWSVDFFMMTSSNGNIFRVTGHLCGEFTGPRWIPAHRPVTRSFDVFFDLRLNNRLSE